jgi:2,3,4,5-tetrahydropyridine-2,6-dicarboxylate N-succinyltransferase
MNISLQETIENLYALDPSRLDRAAALKAFHEFKFFLNRGDVRAAEPRGTSWAVNAWVKKGILLGFRLGALDDVSINDQFRFFDKSTYPLKKLELENGVRLVPGGSSIRDGSYVAPGVVCMPPMYVNVGAYVDENTMIDSHALVGHARHHRRRRHDRRKLRHL